MAAAAAIHHAAGPLRSLAFSSSRSRSLLHLLSPARAISSSPASYAYNPSAAAAVPGHAHQQHQPQQQWGPPTPLGQWSPQGHPPPPPANDYQQYPPPPPPPRNNYQQYDAPPLPPRSNYQQHPSPPPPRDNYYQRQQQAPPPPSNNYPYQQRQAPPTPARDNYPYQQRQAPPPPPRDNYPQQHQAPPPPLSNYPQQHFLHEAIEPKVVHRDIKSSNILIDDDFNGKLSDFGLAKMLGAGKSHITTRVMGTFGYVAPEYANTGLLNEKSDVYSFGVLLLEAVTGRDPVDYGRPANEVHLVEWLKMMVGTRRAEEVVDRDMEVKPTIRALKRALLVALRCVDPDSEKRPSMGQVVRMLEAENVPSREDRRSRRGHAGNADTESKASSSEFEVSGDSGPSTRFQP